MSNNLTIPAAVWACRVDGVPLVAGIMEGECRGHCGPRMDCCEVPHDPPADLVALRDARCGCDDGIIYSFSGGEAVEDPVDETPCHRCHDGRLLVDVRVEGHRDCWAGHCNKCRTVKGLVDVVPVVETRNHGPHSEPAVFPWLTVNDQPSGRVVAHHWHHDAGFRTLTPAHVEALGTIQPGMWAWTFTEVEA